MMQPSPATSFVMTEADFLLEFLVVTLDPPAEFGAIDQRLKADIGRQRGQPILSRLRLVRGPLDEQPLLGWLRGPCHRADTPTREA